MYSLFGETEKTEVVGTRHLCVHQNMEFLSALYFWEDIVNRPQMKWLLFRRYKVARFRH